MWVSVGFAITAVVIPILGILAHARLQGTMYDFAKKVSPLFSLLFYSLYNFHCITRAKNGFGNTRNGHTAFFWNQFLFNKYYIFFTGFSICDESVKSVEFDRQIFNTIYHNAHSPT